MTSLDRQQVEAALPQYEVGDEIGRGAWGLVLAGRHKQLDRSVAIKQLPRAFASDQMVRGRFTAEARLLASLDHPHIVPVYDFVEQDGLCLLVMEKLTGGTVWDRFSTEGFTQPAAVAVVLACAAGLDAAHRRNVLHRDVKPENLMFSDGETVKVTDFGIAKVVGGEETLATRAGEVLGTPAYIAPEQARGGQLSPATDIYALATMLYELLSGQLPFTDDGDVMALLFKHAFEAPIEIHQVAPAVPDDVAAVVMKGLATDPADRYNTSEHFALALAESCTSSWGPGWLLAQNFPVMGAATIVAATTERTPVAAGAEPAPQPQSGHAAAGGTVVSQSSPAPPTVASPETTVPADGAVNPAAVPLEPLPAPVIVGNATAPSGTSRVTKPATAVQRPATVHARSVELDQLAEDDLVPLNQVVRPPAGPAKPVLASLLLFVVLVVLAFVAFHGTNSSLLPNGDIAISGVSPAAGQVVNLDLSKPVTVALGNSESSADHVRLELKALGVPIVSSTEPVTSNAGTTGNSASFDLSGSKFLAAGKFTSEVDLVSHGSVTASEIFPVKTAQSPFVSAEGGAVLLLVLLVVAYLESNLRSLRKGKRKVSAAVSLTILGAIAGVVIVAFAWVAADLEPEPVGVIVAAVLGAGSGLAAGLAGLNVGRRRRFASRTRKAAAT